MGACNTKNGRPQPHDMEPQSGSGSSTGEAGDMVGQKVSGRPVINQSSLVLNNPGKIRDVYNIEDKKIGEGTYGQVCRGIHKSTKAKRAIKIISKAQMKNVRRFREEIEIMKMMDHPNIIKLFESFEDNKNIYLAMELCAGGELFDRIIEAGHLSEKSAAVVTQQILKAIFYMHERSISHRDLKPENFLFLTKDALDKSILKIIDFGLSCRFEPGRYMSTRAGTPFYVAPQVLMGRYDHTCDLWSTGVIMYILLCGYPPFYGRSDQEVLAKVKRGVFAFDDKEWKDVSADAKNLIRGLLRMNPKERITAEKALTHEWITKTAPRAVDVSLKTNPTLMDNLRNFRMQNKLKKAALHIIAGQLDESQIKGLRETFTALDENSDGFLTMEELKIGLEKAGLKKSKTDTDLQKIVEGMDVDGSGRIDYTEFIAAALDKRSYLSENACWTAFKVFDLDGDGRISLSELTKVLAEEENGVDTASAKELLKGVDLNGDGMIDFQEFMAMMKGSKGTEAAADSTSPSKRSPRRSFLSPRRGGA